MTKKKIWLYNTLKTFFLLCFVAPSFGVEIYRCQNGKHVTYQEFPCQSNDQQEVINDTFDSEEEPPKATKIVLQRDATSQFHVDGTLNGIAVKFLIDTGASITAIPQEIAVFAKLPLESTISAKTASGSTTDFKTTIKELKIGNIIQLKDVPAAIIKGDQALLGMDVLKHFEMTQLDNNLTLILR